ncbi:hypothetical protein PIB30_055972 [Stylosanthes scabra]|uniref:Uncharacterized protein n=1 Tax=Stylosanthes scabra TaxID=79078 RepID=A0ABU6TJN0_9FABA|nr:hypothetical protein [Stylosanthes scabra]
MQEALKGSEERAKSLKSIVARLREAAGETEDLIKGLNQRVVEAVNGGVNGNGVVAREGKVVKGLNVQWPMVAAGSTVVLVAVVICVFYGKRRNPSDALSVSHLLPILHFFTVTGAGAGVGATAAITVRLGRSKHDRGILLRHALDDPLNITGCIHSSMD